MKYQIKWKEERELFFVGCVEADSAEEAEVKAIQGDIAFYKRNQCDIDGMIDIMVEEITETEYKEILHKAREEK